MSEERKKGYYIYYTTKIGLAGVDKKVNNQMRVFQEYFDMEKIVIPREESNILKSFMWRLPFGSFGRNYRETFEIIEKPCFIYIRFVPTDKKFLFFLKELRNKFPACRILLEVATYPYGRELLSDISMFPFYFKDILYRNQIKKYVDKVITYSDDLEIFGISTINVKNGICVEKVTSIDNVTLDHTIDLLAVAIFQKAHGYERCIKSMKKYYKQGGKRDIKIHFVGDGNELQYYKKIVEKSNLDEHALFYGRKTGADLDSIYEKADIALGSFGAYKRKITKSSSLKVREYLAKGLPVISGCMEDALQQDSREFYLEFPNNKTIFHMEKVISFYDSIYSSSKNIRQIRENIRNYARERLDMSIVMRPIIEYLEVSENDKAVN